MFKNGAIGTRFKLKLEVVINVQIIRFQALTEKAVSTQVIADLMKFILRMEDVSLALFIMLQQVLRQNVYYQHATEEML